MRGLIYSIILKKNLFKVADLKMFQKHMEYLAIRKLTSEFNSWHFVERTNEVGIPFQNRPIFWGHSPGKKRST